MSTKNRKFGPFILLYIVLFFITGTTTYAEETTAEGGADSYGAFNYRLVVPENQHDREAAYFDLMMTPGQQQTVQIELENASDQEMTIAVSLNGAKTNRNGVIEYGPSPMEDDKSLKFKFKDLVKSEEKVTIPPHTIVPLDINIAMPETSYDGILAGGIQLKQVIKRDESQTGIINEYAYLIALVLRENETPVEPDLELNDVSAGLANYQNAVFVNFSNTQAVILDDMTVSVQISPKDSEEVIYDTKKAGMRMAPNSMINFPVSMNGERMEPGDYKAHIIVTSRERKWEWTREFTITDEEADKFNGQDVYLVQEKGIDWKLIALLAAIAFVLLLSIFFAVRKVRENRKSSKKRKKKLTKKK
ncbi:DUF916 and DUF3324 domain-containing protein [Candidatus Enterococcus clewellii]|uniref:Uncharacterized protein n=1 Tax=Candidatus Enterococcus clewellii TaxID=1834193 RepID=A0A242K4X6_9ENTE|nr:DUF916 and DUF3324 domain-containing protein [Enterococcus sp. 9E7_DIV0242]OTP14581.1 hypothetical protein A5888_002682 [Enterococcus sp. 9E7_DIV0242]